MKKRLTMNEVYDKLEKSTPIPLLNLRTLSEVEMPEWYKNYGLGGSEFREIDYYAILKFGDFVLDKFVWDDNIYTIHQDLLMHLQKLSLLFYRQRKLTYDKLWEIESITFNPINNYDSHKMSTMVRTGSEKDVNNKEFGKTTENVQSGTVTDSLLKTGSETVATKNNQTEKNVRDLNTSVDVTVKNNQSVTVTDTKKQSYKDRHTLTAYANNEVDATERIYTGDGDTNVTTFSGDGDMTNTKNTGTDTTTTSYTGNADTTEQTFNNRKDEKTINYDNLKNVTTENVTKDTEENTKTYNEVTDTFEETQTGNIGVTTSTAMLTEFVNFYGNYSFFERLIGDFVQFICRADFETEVE